MQDQKAHAVSESDLCWLNFGSCGVHFDQEIQPSGCLCVSARLAPLRGPVEPVLESWQCILVRNRLEMYLYDRDILACVPSTRHFRGEGMRETLKRVVAGIIHQHREGFETIIPADGCSGIFYFEKEDGTLEHVCVQLWDRTDKRGRDHAVHCTPLHAHRHNPDDIVFFPK